MKEQLKKHLSSLFRGAPDTAHNRSLYEELLADLYDHYDEQIAAGAAPAAAYETAIGRLGDVSALIEGAPAANGPAWASGGAGSAANKEAKNATTASAPLSQKPRETVPPAELRVRKRTHGIGYATGVALCILSVIPPMFADWMAVFLFLLVGLGVVCFILTAHRYPAFEDDSARSYDPAVAACDHSRANLFLALGVLFCIVSIIPTILLSDPIDGALFMTSCAIGVWMIVFSAHIRPKAVGEAPASPDRAPAWAGGDVTVPPRRRLAWWKILLIVLACVVALGGIAVGAFFFFSTNYIFRTFNDKYAVCDHAGDAQITETVAALDVEWLDGTLTVEPYEGDAVRISELRDGKPVETETEQLHWGVKDEVLYITFCHPRRVRFLFKRSQSNKDLLVQIPADLALAEIRTDAPNTSVTVGAVRAARCDLENVGGEGTDLTVNGLTCERLQVDSVGGAVRIEGAFSYAEINAVSAALSFASSTPIKDLQINTVSGNVSLDLTAGFEVLRIDSVSGNLSLAVPHEGGFTLDMDTVSGKVNTELPMTERAGSRVYGDGAARIRIDTVSGSITIS